MYIFIMCIMILYILYIYVCIYKLTVFLMETLVYTAIEKDLRDHLNILWIYCNGFE